jgi:RimJ/RimL family protein N-acetyltransferase
MKIEFGGGYTLQDWGTAWDQGDQARLIALADDYDVWVNLADQFPHPYTRADAEAWVALQADQDPVVRFAVCDAKGPIGGIGLITREGDLRHSAELGYWLGKPFWGQGIMTAAVRVLIAYAFETLGLLRIDARVRTSNIASVRVLEKLGYQREGLLRRDALKAGVPVDHLLYAILSEA